MPGTETEPNKNNPNPKPNPSKTDEGQELSPKPDVEVNPGIPGTNTEVDLDTQKIKKFPDTRPPERH